MESNHLTSPAHNQIMRTTTEQLQQIDVGGNCRFLALAQDSADIYWLLTPNGDFKADAALKWAQFIGPRHNEPIGEHKQGWIASVHSTDQTRVHDTFIQTIKCDQTTEIECRMLRYDDLYRLLRLRFVPVHHLNGSIHEVIAYGMDITEQTQSQYMNEEQMHLAISAAKIGMWEWNTITNRLTITDQCKALHGFALDETISYEQLLGAVYPADLEARDQAMQEALEAKTEYCVNYRTLWPDSSVHWLTVRGCWFYDEAGYPIRMIATVLDITPLKQAETQQRQTAKRLADILGSISDALFNIDNEWRYTYANAQAEKLLGKNLNELLGQRMGDVTPDFADIFITRRFRQAQSTGQTSHFEVFSFPTKRWFEIHAYPTSEGLSVYYQDITERKSTDKALRESELKFRRIVESNIIGVLIVDISGNIYEANDAYLSLIGYTLEEIANQRLRWTTMIPKDMRQRQAQAIEEFLSTGVSQPFETEIESKEGKRIPVMIGIAQLQNSSTLGIAIVLDISAHKEMEQQKDFFMSMAGHELRTPLTIIKGTLQMIQRRMRRMPAPPEYPDIQEIHRKNADDISQALRQIDIQTRLVNDLLDVSRLATDKLKLTVQHFDLIKLVVETVEGLRLTAPLRSMTLQLPETENIFVDADIDQIRQVINNYITNALKYAPFDSPICIGLDENGKQARVWVQDQGPGLTTEAQRQIWRRFYQVKGIEVQSDARKGLGIGLYICQTIIHQHHGEVGVTSALDKGSTFWFTLPLSPKK